MGVKSKMTKLIASQKNPPYPQYYFDVNESLEQPDQVQFTAPLADGAPFVESDNKQFGLYIQDDWDVTDKLTLNFGLRWDYEHNPSYVDYTVPCHLAAALRGWTNLQHTVYNIDDNINNADTHDTFISAWNPVFSFHSNLFEHH